MGGGGNQNVTIGRRGEERRGENRWLTDVVVASFELFSPKNQSPPSCFSSSAMILVHFFTLFDRSIDRSVVLSFGFCCDRIVLCALLTGNGVG